MSARIRRSALDTVPDMTREECAHNRTTPFAGDGPDFDYTIARYATPEEIAKVGSELEANYKTFGAKMMLGDTPKLDVLMARCHAARQLVQFFDWDQFSQRSSGSEQFSASG